MRREAKMTVAVAFDTESQPIQLMGCYSCSNLFYVCSIKVSSKLTYQGPVVQSIVSLTSSLRGQLVKCFTTL